MFLGYDEHEFGYWMWNLINKKVIRSRDIVFMEENIIVDWETEKKGSSSESTDKEHSDELSTQLAENRIRARNRRRTRYWNLIGTRIRFG